MRVTLRILGLALIDLEASTEDTPIADDWTDSGTTTATPIGFSPSPGDQRWEAGPGGGEV